MIYIETFEKSLPTDSDMQRSANIRHGIPTLLAVLALGCGGAEGSGDLAAQSEITPPLELVASGVVSTDVGEAFPSLAPNGKTLYFATHEAGWTGFDLVQSDRSDSAWSSPTPLPFSGPHNDRALFPSPDGSALYFASDRPVPGHPPGDFNLWVVRRTADAEWSRPVPVPGVNSPMDDFHPAVTAEGTLYFSSDRPGGEGTFDLWRARWTGDGFAEPENLGSVVNTQGEETDVFVDPQGRFLIVVATDRSGGEGGDDLWLTRPTNGGWTPLKNLGPAINSPSYEYGPFVSPDGLHLYLTTHRRGLGDIVRVAVAEVPGLRDVVR